jgi:hypothetical protein
MFKPSTLFLIILFCAVGSFCWGATDSGQTNGSIEVHISIPSYSLVQKDGSDVITVPGYGNFTEPGAPKLPGRMYAIALPPGAEVVSCEFSPAPAQILGHRFKISPCPLPRIIGEENTELQARELIEYENTYQMIYNSNTPYPGQIGKFIRKAGYRRYNLVEVWLTPFSYCPLSGELAMYQKITVRVNYHFPTTKVVEIEDYLPRTEAIARELIINYDQAQQWYAMDKPPGIVVKHPLVIITSDDVITDDVAPLIDWEIEKGNVPVVVPIEWILTNYSGIDDPEKIRNFLRDKYPSSDWGIENVLFVGLASAYWRREIWQDIGHGRPMTDFYYAELSQPDSLSWDSNGNFCYGDDNDKIDFYSEVNVGQITLPLNHIHSFCERSVNYELNSDPDFKKSILLLGAYFWSDTDNAELMEAITAQNWMSTWNKVRLYEQNVDYWSSYPCDYPLLHQNVQYTWSLGKFAFVNWAAHGYRDAAFLLGLSGPEFINSYDCSLLNNDYPAIIFSDASSQGQMPYAAIGVYMLIQGAVGFCGANQVIYAMPAWNSPEDGSSQSLDYYFTTMVTSKLYTQGAALQQALRTMYTQGLWYKPRYEMCDWSLLGNPCLSMADNSFSP